MSDTFPMQRRLVILFASLSCHGVHRCSDAIFLDTKEGHAAAFLCAGKCRDCERCAVIDDHFDDVSVHNGMHCDDIGEGQWTCARRLVALLSCVDNKEAKLGPELELCELVRTS